MLNLCISCHFKGFFFHVKNLDSLLKNISSGSLFCLSIFGFPAEF